MSVPTKSTTAVLPSTENLSQVIAYPSPYQACWRTVQAANRCRGSRLVVPAIAKIRRKSGRVIPQLIIPLVYSLDDYSPTAFLIVDDWETRNTTGMRSGHLDNTSFRVKARGWSKQFLLTVRQSFLSCEGEVIRGLPELLLFPDSTKTMPNFKTVFR